MKVCSSSKPYFNALKNECIICPDKFPLFDFKYNRCISCSGDSVFDNDRHMCMSNGKVSPTVERMIMNTIGWI